jgi:hypothetical protein
LIPEARGSGSWSVRPQPVCIDTAVGLRVLVSKIHFIDAEERMGNNRKGAKVSGSKFGIQGVRGQVFSGDADMAPGAQCVGSWRRERKRWPRESADPRLGGR